jgi:sorting nexin-8
MYWDSLDTDGSGLVSLAALNRLLSTSGLPASTNERIITLLLPSTAQSVNQEQFFAALGLVALAQGGKDVSMQRLNQTSPAELPIPSLRMSSGVTGTPSTSARPLQHPTPVRAYSQTSSNGFGALSTPTSNLYKDPTSSSTNNHSPWDVGPMKAGLPATMENVLESETNGNGYEVGFSQDAGGGAGAGFDEQDQIESTRGWWKDVETIQVTMMAEKEGWFLQKYRLESDVSRFGRRM